MVNQPDIKRRFTKGQMRLQKLLESMGFETILEHPVGDYTIDIFLSSGENAGFEFDGPWHFAKRDKNRDRRIKDEFGIPIMRITEKDLAKEDLREEILEWLSG